MPARPGDMVFNPASVFSCLHVPTLLIAGTEDRVTHEVGIREAVALIDDNAVLLAIEGHHCSFYSGDPQRVAAQAVGGFFNRVL